MQELNVCFVSAPVRTLLHHLQISSLTLITSPLCFLQTYWTKVLLDGFPVNGHTLGVCPPEI